MRRSMYRNGEAGFRGCLLENDQSILQQTSIHVTCPVGGSITILWGDGTASAVACNGVLNNYVHDYVATGQYTIRIVGSTSLITDFRCYGQSWISGDLGQIINGLSVNLLNLYLHSTGVTGNLAAVSGLVNLVTLHLSHTGVTGNLAAVSVLVNLLNLYLAVTGVTGNLAAVSGLVNLLNLYLYTTGVTGNLAAVSGLVNLLNLYLHVTGVTGNLAAVSGLVNLLNLYLYSTGVTDYTSTPLPAWPGTNIRIYSIGLSSGEVDDFLNDFAINLAGAPGTLNMSPNAPHTVASNAAIILINADGWALTVD